eukprot:tig00001497_g9213.t1
MLFFATALCMLLLQSSAAFSVSGPTLGQGGLFEFTLSDLDTTANLQKATVSCSMPDGNPAARPPYASSIAGWYDGASWDTVHQQWSDLSGNGRHATVKRNGAISTAADASGVLFLQGDESAGVQIPESVMNTSTTAYTLVHACLARSAKGRIIDGVTRVWLSGHWDQFYGVAHHVDGWITPDNSNANGASRLNTWLLSVDRLRSYRANGIERTTAPEKAATTADRISVNYGKSGESSSWQCSFVLVYDRELSNAEVANVEVWARLRYGYADHFPGLPSTLPYAFTAPLTGSETSCIVKVPLRPETTYTCNVTTANAVGVSSSVSVSFTTSASPPFNFAVSYPAEAATDAYASCVTTDDHVPSAGTVLSGEASIAAGSTSAAVPLVLDSFTAYACNVSISNAAGTSPLQQLVFVTGQPSVALSVSDPVLNQDGLFQFNLTGLDPADQLQKATVSCSMPDGDPAARPPYASSIAGWYDGASWDTVHQQWSDLSGNGRHATVKRNGAISTAADASGVLFLQGDESAGVQIPESVMNTSTTAYTLVHACLARSAKGRIIDGVTRVWLSGHWDQFYGVAYHVNGWITPDNGNANGASRLNTWLLSVDRLRSYRANGIERTTAPEKAATTADRISVNYGKSGESSSWQCSFVLVYDRELSNAEVANVEVWARLRYGYADHFPGLPSTLPYAFTAPLTGSETSCIVKVPLRPETTYTCNVTTANAVGVSSSVSVSFTTSASPPFNFAVSYPAGGASGVPLENVNGTLHIRIDGLISAEAATDAYASCVTTDDHVPSAGTVLSGEASIAAGSTSAAVPLVLDSFTAYACNVSISNAAGTSPLQQLVFVTGLKPPLPFDVSGPTLAEDGFFQLNLTGLDPSNWLQSATVSCIMPTGGSTAARPPNASSIAGWYDGTSWTGSQWNDLSGNGRHATVKRGIITTTTASGVPVLQGDESAGVQIPESVMNTSTTAYTLVHACLARSAKGRIIDGVTRVWLSGHWDQFYGVAHHVDGWITPDNGNANGASRLNTWLLSVDRLRSYRANGIERTTAPEKAATTADRISVNYGKSGESSSWQCSFVLVYGRELSNAEVANVEVWARLRYGYADHFPGLPSTLPYAFTAPLTGSETSCIVKVPLRPETTYTCNVTTANAVGPEPIAQPVAQPVTQPVAQPERVSQPEPVAQPVAQPIAQPVTQPEAIAQPVAQPEPVAQPAPLAQPIAQPITQPIAQPERVSQPEPVAQPVAQPIAHPVDFAQPEPVAQPEPIAQSEPLAQPEPVAQPATQPVAQPESRSVAKLGFRTCNL